MNPDGPSRSSIESFREGLHEWWNDNARVFPWRVSRNPYHILAAEVMLHRTRAESVLRVYSTFLERFRSIEEVAEASEDSVSHELRSLGLRWRAGLLHQMAVKIRDDYDGEIPMDRSALESLPGVGPYIASAFRCFAGELPEALLDTNTVRILGRVFGTPTTDASRRSQLFRSLYDELLDKKRPREFSLGLIDLAAIVCTPRRPDCEACPVNAHCEYAKSQNSE